MPRDVCGTKCAVNDQSSTFRRNKILGLEVSEGFSGVVVSRKNEWGKQKPFTQNSSLRLRQVPKRTAGCSLSIRLRFSPSFRWSRGARATMRMACWSLQLHRLKWTRRKRKVSNGSTGGLHGLIASQAHHQAGRWQNSPSPTQFLRYLQVSDGGEQLLYGHRNGKKKEEKF